MTDSKRSDSPLDSVFQDAVRRLVDDARTRVSRAAQDGRAILRVRQLQKERDALCIRLGKTAHRLVEGGEISHPALDKGVARLQAMDAEIAELRDAAGEPGTVADEQDPR